MNKNLMMKIGFILAVVIVAIFMLYPPQEKLKWGIDLAGGTSLTYEIDTQGLTPAEVSGLSTRMIRVFKDRVDPANVMNFVWRPIGDTRFEVQVPLASAGTREKRKAYEEALNALLAKNVDAVAIGQSLKKDEADRTVDFEAYGQGDPNSPRTAILKTLSRAYDEWQALVTARDEHDAQMAAFELQMEAKGNDLSRIRSQRDNWIDVNDQERVDLLRPFGDPNLLGPYVDAYRQWADAVNALTDRETGKTAAFQDARRDLNKLNLTDAKVSVFLDLPKDSKKRNEEVEGAKSSFSDRADLIDNVIAAYDAYKPDKGTLDDPADLKRMLRGAGVLEFRILPTSGGGELTLDQQQAYVTALGTEGPRAASDAQYKWCEVEDASDESIQDWAAGTRAIVGKFGERFFILASNEAGKCMLHGGGAKQWKLERSRPTTDDMGRRAIAFSLDDRGAVQFASLTGDNINLPLCILLDDKAISAPNINSRIYKNGIIQGSYTETAVNDLVNKLNAGSLPARLIPQPISEKSIGSSLGEASRTKGVYAGIIGLTVVLAFMLIYYMKAGAIADFALVMNILIVLGIMAFIDATFTLPGIAGIILTIGMSVDANVLIFERIREEGEKGAALNTAIKNGYDRAFWTIFDANLTTFITAAILYAVATEEVKGFAIVLMLGIGSSMFTALFVTRWLFDLLSVKGLIKDKLLMLRLIRQPNIDWMGLRRVFFPLSACLMLGGLVLFFITPDKYDIEFTGGTSATVDFKNDEEIQIDRSLVQQRLAEAGLVANVVTVGDDPNDKMFAVTTVETNKTVATVTFGQSPPSVEEARKQIVLAASKVHRTLNNLKVEVAPEPPHSLEVSTSQVNPSLVKNVLGAAFPGAQISDPNTNEVVNNLIKSTFGDELEIQTNLGPEIVRPVIKITQELADANPILAASVGGIKIEVQLRQAATAKDLHERLSSIRFKPDLADLDFYRYRLLTKDLSEPKEDESMQTFHFVSLPTDAGLRELSTDEWDRFQSNEERRLLAAAGLEGSLPQVTQIDPSIGDEQKTRALIAIFLSFSAIVTYIWVRFGDLRYGLAAIAALVHDVCITLGVVTACSYIAGTTMGDLLLIMDFKISLAMVAAFLTLIGYSLNDTIVIFDRIRENRKKAQMTPQMITTSINQTVSRTILTSLTTFMVVLIMYIFGGEGLRPFTFAIGFGVIVGTYSSVAIAAPILLIGEKAAAKDG